METIGKVTTTLLAFAIFFFVAKKIFWGAIQARIAERQGKIQGDFDRIDALQKEVASMKANYERRLSDIEKEAAAKRQEAINEGRAAATEIVELARKDAQAELEKMRQTIAIESDKIRAELREEVVKLTLGATEKILREKMDSDRDRSLVNDFVTELAGR